MRHPELPVASFLSVPLLLCSLPSHARAGSVCTLALIAWLAVVSIIRGVNSLVWAGNVMIKLEVWCDITTKITVGFTYAVPASALCVLRHLEGIASTRSARTTKADKRRRQKIEAVMCFGVPLIGMALHYVVQGHRLDILEDFGCYPPVYFSVAAIMILWVPPFVMSLVSFVYATMTLCHFLRRRIEFANHLRNSHSAISPGRYVRLMAMALFEMVWDSGVNAYLVYFNTSTGLRPWISWENVHSNFSRVAVFPKIFIPQTYYTQLIWQWWIVPISCFFFFVFFAFGEEAISDYRAVLLWAHRTILRKEVGTPITFGSSSVLPIHRFNPNITLPPSDDSSTQDHKPWDDISLKMPYIADGVTNSSMDEEKTSFALSTLAGSCPPSPSPVATRFTPNIPTLTITRPGSEALSTDIRSPTDPIIRRSSYPRIPSPTTAPSDNDRISTSMDLDITVSPAYYSNEDSLRDGTRYPGAQIVPADPESIVQDTEDTHPYGGIRLTVEKMVTL